MKGRTMRWLVVWDVVVTVLLLASVTASTTRAGAADLPQVYAATSPLDVGGDGSSATIDDTISTTTPDVLVSVSTGSLSTAHTHVCLVTASADTVFAADGSYTFGLSEDVTTPTVAASDRRIEMFNNAGINDDSFEEVSTTYAFTGVSGSHTFYFSARKNAATDGDVIVGASAITVVCMKKTI